MGSDDIAPIIGVDLTQQPPIHYKRTLAFINHFITNSVRFLNKFSAACEEKFAEIQSRVQRLEITLSILEAKLSSIPGLDQVAAPTVTSNTVINQPEQVQNAVTNEASESVEPVPDLPAVEVMVVHKDPRYAKFFKMASVGVPIPAVKNKMAQEGLNPDLIDTPNAPVPDENSSAPVAFTVMDSDNDNNSSDENDTFSEDDSSSANDD